MRLGVGATTGIRLVAACSPFDVLPPALWAGFKKAVMEHARDWGLNVHFGEDDGSLREAEGRFWQQQRAHAAGQTPSDAG